MDILERPITHISVKGDKPLLGITILLIEDSRFACDAMRMMALRGGARLRRADSLATAARHLAVYRPTVVIVDAGLPDGDGVDYVRELTGSNARIPVILGTSGDDFYFRPFLQAGAQGFLTKPFESMHAFQNAILQHLEDTPRTPYVINDIDPYLEIDRLSYRDDLCHAATLIEGNPDADRLDYISRFLDGVGLCAGDGGLMEAAKSQKPDQMIAVIRKRLAQLTAL